MKIVLCGGGTAGHIYPALAIAEILNRQYKKAEFLFIGREGGDENSAVEKDGIPIKTLKISGIKRSLSPKNVVTLLSVFKAKGECIKILKDFSPDLILGTGDYLGWRVNSAGITLGIKTAIHESNAYPGLVTRLLSKKCDLIMLNFEESKQYLDEKAKTVTVGNPIRRDFSKINKKSARKLLGIDDKDFVILSFGGSTGAERLNEALIELIGKYSSKISHFTHIHATGKRYFGNYSKECELLRKAGSKCRILDYIEDMPLYLKACDLAITRSGAMTISELSGTKTPAILIPSPNVTANHQYLNAKALSNMGAAILIEEKELTYEVLKAEIEKLIASKNALLEMSKRVSEFNKENCNSLIVLAIKEIMPK